MSRQECVLGKAGAIRHIPTFSQRSSSYKYEKERDTEGWIPAKILQDCPARTTRKNPRLDTATSIAVVIPTLNEERTLPRTLLTLRQLCFDEVVLVDGGSHGEWPVCLRAACMENRTDGAACRASAETGVQTDSSGLLGILRRAATGLRFRRSLPIMCGASP